MSHDTILPNNDTMINFFRKHHLSLHFSKPALRHIGEFITAATAKGYRGKVTDLAEWSSCHRTSLGHFLSNGIWDESYIQQMTRQESLKFVHSLSEQTEQPIFVIHDCWPIEIFFRQAKGNLGFNGYQVRSIAAIERLWTLLAFTHLYCTIGLGEPSLVGDGLRNVRKSVKADYVRWIYECGQKSISLDVVLKRLKIA